MKKNCKLIFLSIVLFLSTTSPSYAYLDVGTATLIFQGLVGGAVSLLVLLKLYWLKIVDFFSNENVKIAADKNKQKTETHAEQTIQDL